MKYHNYLSYINYFINFSRNKSYPVEFSCHPFLHRRTYYLRSNVLEYPSFLYMDVNCIHQQSMVYSIKYISYVHIQHSYILEASLTNPCYRIMNSDF